MKVSISELLSHATALHEAFKKTKTQYASRFSPDFNPCDFIDFDELKISRMIAWLIDSRGSHCQQSMFLKLFLLRLGADWTDDMMARAQVIVEAPAYAERRRRIDILLLCDGRAIGIENKLWGAGDQSDQVKDYLAHLDKEAPGDPHRCLLYLTVSGSEPAKNSISEAELKKQLDAGRLRLWSFQCDIVEWLRACQAASQSARVSAFIDELSRKLSKEIEGIRDMTETSQLVESVLKSPAHVRAAFDIASAAEEIRGSLVTMLVESLKVSCAAAGWRLISDLSVKPGAGLSIDFGSHYPGLFRLQFEHGKFTYLIFGLVDRVKQSKADAILREQISSVLRDSQVGSGDWWHWFRRAGIEDEVLPVDLNWNNTAEPWVAIADGTLPGLITKAAQQFKEILDEKGELNRTGVTATPHQS
jgi:hypothetical protein